jgi:hypothetical protein
MSEAQSSDKSRIARRLGGERALPTLGSEAALSRRATIIGG